MSDPGLRDVLVVLEHLDSSPCSSGGRVVPVEVASVSPPRSALGRRWAQFQAWWQTRNTARVAQQELALVAQQADHAFFQRQADVARQPRPAVCAWPLVITCTAWTTTTVLITQNFCVDVNNTLPGNHNQY